jgi:hypothetical protein
MDVFMVTADGLALYRYLQSLINAWPGNPENWTPEQHQVSRAFHDLEGALWRAGKLPEGDSSP